jgi:hypothetical protein
MWQAAADLVDTEPLLGGEGGDLQRGPVSTGNRNRISLSLPLSLDCLTWRVPAATGSRRRRTRRRLRSSLLVLPGAMAAPLPAAWLITFASPTTAADTRCLPAQRRPTAGSVASGALREKGGKKKKEKRKRKKKKRLGKKEENIKKQGAFHFFFIFLLLKTLEKYVFYFVFIDQRC